MAKNLAHQFMLLAEKIEEGYQTFANLVNIT